MSIEWQVRWSTWPTNWPNNEAPNYPVTWFAFEQRPIKKCLCDIWEDFWVLIHISKYLPSEMGDKDSEPSVEKCPLVRFIDAFSSSFFALRQIFLREILPCPGPGNEERGLLWMQQCGEILFWPRIKVSSCLASTMPFLLIVMSHNMLSRHQMEWRNFPSIQTSQNAD